MEATGDFDDHARFDKVTKKIIVITGGNDDCIQAFPPPESAASAIRARLELTQIKADLFIIGVGIPKEQRQRLIELATAAGTTAQFADDAAQLQQQTTNAIAGIQNSALKTDLPAAASATLTTDTAETDRAVPAPSKPDEELPGRVEPNQEVKENPSNGREIESSLRKYEERMESQFDTRAVSRTTTQVSNLLFKGNIDEIWLYWLAPDVKASIPQEVYLYKLRSNILPPYLVGGPILDNIKVIDIEIIEPTNSSRLEALAFPFDRRLHYRKYRRTDETTSYAVTNLIDGKYHEQIVTTKFAICRFMPASPGPEMKILYRRDAEAWKIVDIRT